MDDLFCTHYCDVNGTYSIVGQERMCPYYDTKTMNSGLIHCLGHYVYSLLGNWMLDDLSIELKQKPGNTVGEGGGED